MSIKNTAQSLKILLNGLVLHALLCGLDFYTVKYSGNLHLLIGFVVCLAIAFAGEITAKKIKHNFFAFTAAIGVSALSLFLMIFSLLPAMCAMFSVFVFAWIMFLRYSKIAKRTDYAHISFILLFIFVYLISLGFDAKKLSLISCVEGIAFLIINMFLSGVSAHEKFITENISVQNFPLEQIRKTYFSLLSIFTAGCLGITTIACSISVPADSMGFISDMLHKLYEFLPKIESPPGTAKEPGKIGGDQYAQALVDFGIESKTNEWVENVGTVIAVIIFVVSIVLILWWFLIRIINNLKQTRHVGADKLEFAFADDVHEKIKREKFVAEDEGNDKKIRKLYKKYILKKTKKNVKKSETPGMLQSRIAAEEEKGDIIRSIYEKARYSQSECSSEDAEMLKKSMK